jgi:flagella basal body P-ring formation protein FlgA
MRFRSLAVVIAIALLDFLLARAAFAATLEEALLDVLIEKGAPGDAAVSIVGRAPAGIDPDALEIAKLDFDVQTGRFVATLKLATGRTYGLQGKVEPGQDVPVLNRPLEPGEVAADEDVMFVRVAQSRLARGAITDAVDIVGFSARRQLRPGIALRTGDFEKPIVIRKGDTVTMVFKAPGIELTARGKAMDNGAIGDTVAIVNGQSHKQVDAVVTGTGSVTVSPQNVALN